MSIMIDLFSVKMFKINNFSYYFYYKCILAKISNKFIFLINFFIIYLFVILIFIPKKIDLEKNCNFFNKYSVNF